MPMTTITVKNEPNVCRAFTPVSRTPLAAVLFATASTLCIWVSTIAPTPTIIASDTIASASGPRESIPLICPLTLRFAVCLALRPLEAAVDAAFFRAWPVPAWAADVIVYVVFMLLYYIKGLGTGIPSWRFWDSFLRFLCQSVT